MPSLLGPERPEFISKRHGPHGHVISACNIELISTDFVFPRVKFADDFGVYLLTYCFFRCSYCDLWSTVRIECQCMTYAPGLALLFGLRLLLGPGLGFLVACVPCIPALLGYLVFLSSLAALLSCLAA